jgi:3'(2'), 5'-bisphosphate nucleotidase
MIAPIAPLIPPLLALVARAGRDIMGYYTAGFTISHKADKSPVTEADMRADALLCAGLTILTPGVPIVTEEQVALGRIPDIAGQQFWLVDPLDGTREFCSQTPEFTVNVALVQQGVPVFGVVGVPAESSLYWGGPGLGAFERNTDGIDRALTTRSAPLVPVATASRSHRDGKLGEAFLAELGVVQTLRVGSALKSVLIARGDADVQPRLSPVSEWDLAAGHALVSGAGGAVLGLDGQALQFGATPNFVCPYHVICSGALIAPVRAVLAAGSWQPSARPAAMADAPQPAQ